MIKVKEIKTKIKVRTKPLDAYLSGDEQIEVDSILGDTVNFPAIYTDEKNAPAITLKFVNYWIRTWK